jgi:hypothetical protein
MFNLAKPPKRFDHVAPRRELKRQWGRKLKSRTATVDSFFETSSALPAHLSRGALNAYRRNPLGYKLVKS